MSNQRGLKIKEAAEWKLKRNIKVPVLSILCLKIIGLHEEMDETEIVTRILKINVDI